jgi:hypothetical protein
MWPFTKTKLAGPEEFPAVIDHLSDKLRSRGLIAEADRLHKLVHQMAWTTSTELYGELRLALSDTKKQHKLPAELAAEVRRLIKSIDQICRWR